MSQDLQKNTLLGVLIIALLVAATGLHQNQDEDQRTFVSPDTLAKVSESSIPPVQKPASQTAVPLATENKAPNGVKELVAEEKALLYRRKTDWTAHELALKAKVSRFTSQEFKVLAQTVISQAANIDEREVSVYLLSLAGLPAREALNMIASADIPAASKSQEAHAMASARQKEISLRLNALESLDVLAIQSPQEIQEDLQTITLLQQDPSLKNFAHISLMGIAQGKPGKLSRWLNKIATTSKESL